MHRDVLTKSRKCGTFNWLLRRSFNAGKFFPGGAIRETLLEKYIFYPGQLFTTGLCRYYSTKQGALWRLSAPVTQRGSQKYLSGQNRTGCHNRAGYLRR